MSSKSILGNPRSHKSLNHVLKNLLCESDALSDDQEELCIAQPWVVMSWYTQIFESCSQNLWQPPHLSKEVLTASYTLCIIMTPIFIKRPCKLGTCIRNQALNYTVDGRSTYRLTLFTCDLNSTPFPTYYTLKIYNFNDTGRRQDVSCIIFIYFDRTTVTKK